MMLRPHRGAVILVLGILTWFICPIVLGIISWVMGNADLKAMDAGQMDPEGRGLTQAGKILGMINVFLYGGILCLYVLFIVVIIILATVGAAAGAGSGP